MDVTHQVVMRNINLIVQKQPNMLQTDVRYFVCKYNDPLYVKLEKIAVMVGARDELRMVLEPSCVHLVARPS